jgi:uncharacterized membrane protein YdbT with pleckstrin-like domain
VSSEDARPFWRRPVVIAVVVLVLLLVIVPWALGNTLTG